MSCIRDFGPKILKQCNRVSGTNAAIAVGDNSTIIRSSRGSPTALVPLGSQWDEIEAPEGSDFYSIDGLGFDVVSGSSMLTASMLRLIVLGFGCIFISHLSS